MRFASNSPDAALLFVDDGSTDGTGTILARVAEEVSGRIDVLRLPRNVGKAEAVRQGALAAFEKHPQYVGYWDADLSTPLDAVPGFLAVLDTRPRLDIVMGARVLLLGREVQRRRVRHYLGRVFATGASLVLGLPIYDTQCGAKMFRANEPVKAAFASPFLSTWAFDVELLARYIDAVGAADAKSGIVELPLEEWRDVAGSKVRLLDGITAFWHLLRITMSRRRR